MTERQLRYRAGVAITGGHFAAILSIVAARVSGGFSTEECTTLLAITAPLFSGYSSAILAFIISDRHTKLDKSRGLTGTYSALMFVIPLVFSLVLIAGVWLEAYRLVFTSFEDFKGLLTAFESGYAVYVSIFVYSLFKPVVPDHSRVP